MWRSKAGLAADVFETRVLNLRMKGLCEGDNGGQTEYWPRRRFHMGEGFLIVPVQCRPDWR